MSFLKPSFSLIAVLFTASTFAQDPRFSMDDAYPTYENSAFTGTAKSLRIGNGYRLQWPNLSGGFKTNHFYADLSLNSKHGVGLAHTWDKAGLLTTQTVMLHYAFDLKLGETTHLRIGVQPHYIRQDMDWDKVTFGEMIDPRKGFVYEAVNIQKGSAKKFDLNTGILLYTPMFYVGYAAHHLFQPNMSLINGSSPLPLKHSMQFGYHVLKNEGLKLSVLVRSKFQQQFESHSVLTQLQFKHVLLGLGYHWKDAIMSRVGLAFKHFNLIYGYDHTVSDLTTSTGGAHEIGLQFLLNVERFQNDNHLAVSTF